MAEVRTRAEMLALVREWETSGETRPVFAERHGVSLPRFDYWRQQLRRERQRARGDAFAPVRVVADVAAPVTGAVDLVLSTGDRLIVREGTTPELLRTVVELLRAPC
jgi:hypothetical protein